jgi:hypothetical protein
MGERCEAFGIILGSASDDGTVFVPALPPKAVERGTRTNRAAVLLALFAVEWRQIKNQAVR